MRVHKTQIIGTDLVVFSVWVESSLFGGHSGIKSFDDKPGVWFGRVGTERLPPALDALPAMTQERSDAVRAFQQECYERAYAAIVEQNPEAAYGRRDMGEITIAVGPRR